MFKPTPFDKLLQQQQPRSVILNRRGLFYIGASLVPKCPKILTDSWTNWRVGQFKDAMKADKPGRPNMGYGSKSLDVGLFDIGCTPLWGLVLPLMPSGHCDPQNSRRCPFKSVHISSWQSLTPSSPRQDPEASLWISGCLISAQPWRLWWCRWCLAGRASNPRHRLRNLGGLQHPHSPAESGTEHQIGHKVSQRSVYVRYNRWSAHRARCVSSCFCAPGHF